MSELKQKIKSKIKQEIKNGTPYVMVIYFCSAIMIYKDLYELYHWGDINDTVITITIWGGTIVTMLVSKSYRALVLLVISGVYYIAKSALYLFIGIASIPFKLANHYESLDEKNKKRAKTAMLVTGGILGKLLLNKAINSQETSMGPENAAFVDPHEVSGYVKKDGAIVNSYWRDGDGNPLTQLTKENGGGYTRSK